MLAGRPGHASETARSRTTNIRCRRDGSEKAQLRRVRFHDLRHTFASLLIAQGESLAYVRDQLGHASIQLTVDTYGHLIPGANRQAVDRLDDAPEDASPPGVQEPTAPYLRTRGRRLRGAI